MLGDHVTTETGTGCVHTAPDHGMEDFVVANKYGIRQYSIILMIMAFSATACRCLPASTSMSTRRMKPFWRYWSGGVRCTSTHKITHSYAHCWRTKTPLIYRATPQWFIGMQQNGLLDKALKAVKDVTWYPSWGQARIEGMLENGPRLVYFPSAHLGCADNLVCSAGKPAIGIRALPS